MKYQWNEIMCDIENNNYHKIVQMCKKLDIKEYEDTMSELINEMKNTNHVSHRNTIAIVLMDLKYNPAIEEMITLIENSKNSNCIGTLVYALQNLDCEKSIVRIFDLILKGNYEVRCNMYNLLECKIDKMDEADRKKCFEILQEEKAKTKETLELIEDIEENIFEK